MSDCHCCLGEISPSPLRHAPRQGTRRLWCPTWYGAEKGPIDVCEEHAKTFMPEHNPYHSGGSFHWADEADRAFAFCEAFFPVGDERGENIRGMLAGAHSSRAARDVFVVDGKAWLRCQGMGLATEHYVRLGEHAAARELFPVLFAEPIPSA